jgi:hypothetical protein
VASAVTPGVFTRCKGALDLDMPDLGIFLSCSFHNEDRTVVEFFRAVCEGLGLRCRNVDGAYAQMPAQKARELIEQLPGVLAIATRRSRFDTGEYSMPDAVREEIAMGFQAGKRVLIFTEQAVAIKGFEYATRSEFERDRLCEPDAVRRIVSSIDEFRTVLRSASGAPLPAPTDFFAEEVQVVMDVEKQGGGDFIWSSTLRRTLVFSGKLSEPLRAACWAQTKVTIPADAPPIDATVAVDEKESSRPFKLDVQFVERSAQEVQMRLLPQPLPGEGDRLTISTRYRSRYLFPVFDDEIAEPSWVEVGGIRYKCFDGFVPIQPTRTMKLLYRFPEEYGLTRMNLSHFVAGFSGKLDYQNPHERKRVTFEPVCPGETVILCRLEVRDPLMHHMYGIVWNPPARPARGST